jgi:hypothetical protein
VAVILWGKFLGNFYQLVYITKQVLNITFTLSGLLVFSLIYLVIVNVYFTVFRAFNALTPENIQGMRSLVDLLVSNSKLLPELMKLTNQLLKADIKLAEFHKNLTKSAAKHQTKLDKTTGSPEFEDMKLKFNEWLVS